MDIWQKGAFPLIVFEQFTGQRKFLFFLFALRQTSPCFVPVCFFKIGNLPRH